MRKDIKSYKKTGLKSATQESFREPPQSHSTGKDKPKEVGSSTTRAENKPAENLAITIQRTSPKPRQVSATPSENSSRNPTADAKKPKPKKEKKRKKEKAKMANSGVLAGGEDPFRDLEPMQVIDADDFRLESSEKPDQPGNSSEEALLPRSRHADSGKLGGKSKKKGRRHRGKDKTSDDHVCNPATEVKPMQTAMRLSGGGYKIYLHIS